jgi:PAS domain S-box-containing protein
VGLYFVVGILWMIITDNLLAVVADLATITLLQTLKGGLFVAFTGIMLFLLIRRSMAILQSSQQMLQRAARGYHMLSRCNQALVRAASEPELLQAICRALVDGGGYRLAWIGFAEQDPAKPVRPVAWAGYEAGYMETVNITWADTERGQGPTGRAIRDGTTHLMRHIATDSAYAPWREEALRRGYASSIALPLQSGGQVFGALNVYATEPDAFDALEVELLEELASDLVYGIAALRAEAQRRQAEDELRESEERFRATFEQAAVGIAHVALDGRFLRVNRRFCDITDYSQDEILERSVQDITYPADLETDRAYVRQTLAGAIQTYTMEKRYIRRDRSLVWVDLTGSLVRDAAGTPKYFIGVVQDITDRKRTEEALQRTNYHLEMAQRVGKIGSWEWDVITDLVTWSAEMYRIFGLDPAQFPNNVPMAEAYKVIHPDDLPRVQATNRQILQQWQSIPIEYRVVRPDGTTRTVYSDETVLFDGEGRVAKIVGVVQDITERKQAEETLAAERNLLRTLIDAVPDYIYVKDRESRFLIANAFVAERMGAESPESLLGKSDADFYPPELAAKYRADELAVIQTGEPLLNIEEMTIDPTGATRWLLTTKVPLRNSQGDIIGIVGNNRDITERKQIAEAERKQRLMAEALHDIAAALSSTLNLDEVLDRILDNLERVLPYDTANIAFIEGGVARITRCRGYDDPDLAVAILQQRWPVADVPYLHQVVETGQAIMIHDLPVYLGLPEDTRLWTRGYIAAPIRAFGQVIGVISLNSTTPGFFKAEHTGPLQAFADHAAIAIQNAQLYDALRLHAADLARRVEERTAELRAVLDNIGEGILYLDNRQIKYLNRAFSQLTGYETAEVVGQEPRFEAQMVPNTGADHAHLGQATSEMFQQGGTWRGEVQIRHKDGHLLDVGVTNSAVIAPDGQLLGNVIVIQDISECKALQAQKDRFIANASHELRTPVTTINLRLYLLRRQPEKLEEHLRILEQAVARMTTLVEGLLDLSRFERGVITLKREQVVLQTLLTDVIAAQQPQADDKQLRLECVLPAEPVVALLDPIRITQVISNLVGNAINYTPSGGQVVVEMAVEAQEAVIRVRDTGIGIAPDMLERIFEPFFRVDQTATVRGAGLGLAISKEIVDLHGGTITVESEVGRGSIFTVRLPLNGGAPEE